MDLRFGSTARAAIPIASLATLIATLAGCSGSNGADGTSCTVTRDEAMAVSTITCEDGTTVDVNDGADGNSCTVARDDDAGTATITCEDGTTATVSDGADGGSCSVSDDGFGTKTITCDDGTVVTITDGVSPLPPGEGPGLVIEVATAAPGNGTHFVAGEQIAITITFTDDAGGPVLLSGLGLANLYMNGPRAVLLNKSANALLDASGDRDAPDRQHHYINLKTTSNTNLVVVDNVLTYTTEAITDEDAGTYTIGVWAKSASTEYDQGFELHDVQLGTADAEAEIVDGCGDCHLGTANGQMYMHHVDPGYSPFGNPALDSAPPGVCRTCHSQDGYAAFQQCSDGTRPPCTGGATLELVADPLIRRVHGVHNGANLRTDFNTDPSDGDFHDYSNTVFPADIRNCVKCHDDDSWKEEPTRLACGSCHDNLDFTTGDLDPPRLGGACTTTAECPTAYTCNTADNVCERDSHAGGPASDDSGCRGCHTPDTGLSPISVVHALPTQSPTMTVTATLSAPANTTHYESGETPVLTLAFTDATTGAVIDPNTFTEATFYRAQLYVSGPRRNTVPVLTTPALAGTGGGYYVYVDYRVRTDVADEDPRITRTATELQYQLADVAGLEAGTYTVMTRARASNSDPSYSWTSENFQIETATVEAEIAGGCTTCHEDSRMHGYATFEPDLCKTCHDYERGSTDVGWDNSNFGYGAAPLSRRVHGIHFGAYVDYPGEIYTSRSGVEYFADSIFPQDVRNCVTCHSDSSIWEEAPARLACLACHDSTSARSHATLNTYDPTPDDPYSGDEIESCTTCHGDGRQFSTESVHNISDPYRAPYPR